MEAAPERLSKNAVSVDVYLRPPKGQSLALKRHSLQSAESIVKFRQLTRHSSQPKLLKDGSNGSATEVLRRENLKSSSLAQLHNFRPLKESGKTLSASNLAAVSDSNLSIKEAVPPRSYDKPNTTFSTRKMEFRGIVQRYYHQLTNGCGNETCRNKFCFSSKDGRKFSQDIAAILSIELASTNKQYFCNSVKTMMALPANVFEGDPDKPRPFLHCLFSTSPFKTLFEVPDSMNAGSEPCLSQSQVNIEGKNKNNYPETASVAASANEWSTIDKSEAKQNSLFDSWENLDTKRIKPSSSSGQISNYSKTDMEFSKFNLTGNLVTEDEFQFDVEDFCESDSSLNEIMDIEEFEKECALEMSSGYVQEFSLTHFTLPMLESSVENYKDCKDSSFLVNTIRTVFTSPEALNESFRKDTQFETNDLDVRSVQEAYSILVNLEPSDIFTVALHNAMEIHISSLENVVIQPGKVNQLVIVMENPLLANSPSLLRKLSRVLIGLSAEAQLNLICILAQYNQQSFLRLLKVSNKCIILS